MSPEYDQEKVSKAFDIIKAAMIADCPGEKGSYAHSWHCNIAMMCYDAIRTYNGMHHEAAHKIGNDAATRFMKLCFDVKTKA